MFTHRQQALLQGGAVAVLVFFVALIAAAEPGAAFLWALILGVAVMFLLRQNVRVSHGVDIFRDDAPTRTYLPEPPAASAPAPRPPAARAPAPAQTAAATSTPAPAPTPSPAPAAAAPAPAGPVSTPIASTAPEPAAPAPDAPAGGPPRLDAPRDGKADDLTQIIGIGPALQKMLNDLGYWHFDQIAAWTPSQLAWVDDHLNGFRGRASRDRWVEQAAEMRR